MVATKLTPLRDISRTLLPLAAVTLMALGTSGSARAQEGPDGDEPSQAEPAKSLVIATKDVPPFSYKNKDGEWAGITVALVRRISKLENFTFEFKEMSLDHMLDAVAAGEVDAAAAALTITAEREARLDFTHPFHSSGLGIAVLRDQDGLWWTTLSRLGSVDFLQAIGALLLVLVAIGVVIWLAERGRNEQFPPSVVNGVSSGLWWSAVTMTTVGYGDKAPVTPLGRLIGLIWMFASIIIISGFTAAIATSLTVGELKRSIQGLNDLRGKRVVTVSDSTSAAFLEGERINFRSVASVQKALDLLAAKRADAVVYDLPVLRYLLKDDLSEKISLLPNLFARQDYGVALPPDSDRREAWNRRILTLIESSAWTSAVEEYLGTLE